MSKRNELIDQIKGISIVAVVLFHLGLFQYGYLGVDVFYAVAGFLTASSVAAKLSDGTFSYWGFMTARVRRVMPIVLLGGLVTLLSGIVLMMPDDFDHAARSVAASNCFVNNILCYHSNSDYWATKNEYAPMLHFWYLGVLFQLYLVYPIAVGLGRKISKGRDWGVIVVLLLLSAVSAVGWCLTPVPLHFYNMPFRFFEFGLGALLYYFGLKVPNWNLPLPGLAVLGRCSLSIYVWHYILLAFVRYALAPQMGVGLVLMYAAVLSGLTFLSYRYVEARRFPFLLQAFLFVLSTGFAALIWVRAGVFYDIPELDIDASNVRRGMHLAYCDRIYAYEKDFPENGKVNVLVLGNSWARDWANVLLESSVSNRINVSYSFVKPKAEAGPLLRRIEKADIVFIRGVDTPEIVVGKKRIYHIGYKWFGPSNGFAFSRRFRRDYYTMRIQLPEDVMRINEGDIAKVGGGKFIDLIGTLCDKDGLIPVFSDDRKMISHDCYHLTQGGARFLAKILKHRIEEVVLGYQVGRETKEEE